MLSINIKFGVLSFTLFFLFNHYEIESTGPDGHFQFLHYSYLQIN